MKKLRNVFSSLTLLVVACLLFYACQQDQSSPEVALTSPQDAKAALQSGSKVDFIVNNFHVRLDEETVELIHAAYLALTPAEVEEFIEKDYQRRLKAGEDAKLTELHRKFRLELNAAGLQQFNKPFTALSDEEIAAVAAPIMAKPEYALAEATASAPNARVQSCTNWNYTFNLAVRSTGAIDYDRNTFIGDVRFCPGGSCQKDCDLLFRSRNYNRYYIASGIWHTNTTGSRNVLFWGGCTSCTIPGRRVTTGTNEEFLEFGVGIGRVQANYGFGRAQVFANEVIVKLTVR